MSSIFEFNPWWESGGINREFERLQRRMLFSVLKSSLQRRPIDVIVGLRRVGKTVLMYHLIDHLLKNGVDSKRILYFSFDVERQDIGRIIREYEERVLKARVNEKRCFLFFDEIHKLADWENKIKVLYDLNPNVKMVLSGSASLNLMKGSRESLAGRVVFHTLSPLKYLEFLKLKGEKIPDENDFEIHERRLSILFGEYLVKGFPETLEMSESEAKNYVRELVAERVIYRDIPESFRIEDIEIVRILANYCFENPGTIINVDSLSKDLGRHRKTIRNALNYLELSFLIKRVSNLRKSLLASSRKNKKAYPLHQSLATTRDEDKILETTVRSEINAEYYWRKGNSEVDFVIRNKEIIPVEVKSTEEVKTRDLNPLVKFSKLFNARKAVVLYRGVEKELQKDGVKISLIPILKYLCYPKP